MNTKKWISIFAAMLAFVLILAACGGGQTDTPDPTTAPAEPTAVPEVQEEEPEEVMEEEPEPTEENMEEVAMPDVDFAVRSGGALEAALKGEYEGTTVTVDGAFEGNDPDGVKFARSMEAFEEATGITVNYIGNKEFEGSIAIRVDAGDAPDIVDFPQPGSFANFAREGHVVPVSDYMPADWLAQQYNDGWREFNTVDGTEYGVMMRFSGKSLVWYPKDDWDAAGYEIPETWDDLLTLTQTIADDGDAPWCIGIESGAATGWAATDWTEEMMLRTTSLDNYDAWVAGELAFDSPEVKNAIETWSSVWFNDDYVLGGRQSIVSTSFGDSPTPLFEDPPQCWLHKQANFITSFFPEGAEYGVDYDFFYLPPVDEAYGKPFLVAGDLLAMFNDRPEVRALMEYFTTPQSVIGWTEGGGAIAAHQTATRDLYGSDLDWGVSELVAGATSFRFDGSDLMPGEVGAGSFWEQISSYVAGSTDLDAAMQAIDATWPAGAMGQTGGDDGDMMEAGFAVMPGGALEAAMNGDYAGTTVTVDGAFEGNDPDGVKFARSMEALEEATGITVNYIGNKEFEGSIAIRVDAGDAPDIVDFPQPGAFANFAREGHIVPVTDFISEEWLSQQYNDGWREFNTVDGEEFGVMMRFSGKSLVWYPKDDWDQAGYEIPETWDELLELTQTITDDGDAPWCIGIESGAATGWAATDWTEEMMLRTTSLENYDAWVAGELAFDSPEVKNAIETWSSVWFNDDYVLGGRQSIVSTSFGDSPTPLFEDPPQCWLHKQANFITSFFPEGAEYGVDYDFFYLPPVDEAYGKPFLVAGDLVAMFNDRPEVRAVMEYFTTPQSVVGWTEGGGAIAAHQTATRDMYGSDLDWGVSELVAGATSFRFDGSDLMPGEVGAGSFWEQISSYVAGSTDLDAAMQAIDATWPAGAMGQTGGEMMDAGFAVMAGGELEAAMNGDYEGTTVTVDGAFEGNDPDGVKFARSMEAFEEATGITVNYIGNKEFEGSIAIRVDAGDAPDIVDFPQPGSFANFAREGHIVPVTEFISEEWLSQQYNDGWREFNTVDGEEFGVMMRFSGKSLVWYPKDDWDQAGYEIPETWDELLDLTQTITDDGDAPWCIGIESGAATGWAATDWTEEMMLRTTSLENYDAWVAGELAFDSPEVKNAIETWSSVWFNDDYVLGGRQSIVSTSFGDSPTPLFEDPPQCWLHKQANFITSFFPEGAEYGVDYDFFYLPPVDEAYGKPFLVAGDLVAMFNDRPEVRALMEYFTTPQSVVGWTEGGGAIAAHQTATRDMYGSDLDWGVSELVAGATSFRFDGSDLMPGEVGAGSFWEQISSYVAGSSDLDEAMQAIDATWP